jgi:hypothetical protein
LFRAVARHDFPARPPLFAGDNESVGQGLHRSDRPRARQTAVSSQLLNLQAAFDAGRGVVSDLDRDWRIRSRLEPEDPGHLTAVGRGDRLQCSGAQSAFAPLEDELVQRFMVHDTTLGGMLDPANDGQAAISRRDQDALPATQIVQ